MSNFMRKRDDHVVMDGANGQQHRNRDQIAIRSRSESTRTPRRARPAQRSIPGGDRARGQRRAPFFLHIHRWEEGGETGALQQSSSMVASRSIWDSETTTPGRWMRSARAALCASRSARGPI